MLEYVNMQIIMKSKMVIVQEKKREVCTRDFLLYYDYVSPERMKFHICTNELQASNMDRRLRYRNLKTNYSLRLCLGVVGFTSIHIY
jgi:hypothetical protein